MRKLPLITRLESFQSWSARNLRITDGDEGRRLRVTLRSGSRAEQAIIINALLRADLQGKEDRIKDLEGCIRSHEESITELEKRIKVGLFRESHDSYRKSINNLRSNRIPSLRTEIARLKQLTVVRWARYYFGMKDNQ